MAATLKTYIVKATDADWNKIWGVGVEGLAATDETTWQAQIQNIGGDTADIYIGYVDDSAVSPNDGSTPPATDTDAGVFKFADIANGGFVLIDRDALASGYTVWVKSANTVNVKVSGRFGSVS